MISGKKKIVVRLVEAIIVSMALLVLVVRTAQSNAYGEYVRNGGRCDFWQWFAKDRCGLHFAEDPDEIAAAERAAAQEKLEATRKREMLERAKAAVEQMKAEELQCHKLVKRSKKTPKAKQSVKSIKERKKPRASSGHGGKVNVGGKSSYRVADGATPYRVNGIRGIEFGSTDNAPALDAKPVMVVSYDANGNEEFRSLRWEEVRELSESIYGFEKAELTHTYDTEQLSTVSLQKSFPLTEEGMKQAVDFYTKMSSEASTDLGFEVIDIDRTGNEKSSTIYEFRNGDGETKIHGSVNVWNDKRVTVSLSVTDTGYSKMVGEQSSAAYERSDGGLDTTRVRVVGKDYSQPKAKANNFINSL